MKSVRLSEDDSVDDKNDAMPKGKADPPCYKNEFEKKEKKNAFEFLKKGLFRSLLSLAVHAVRSSNWQFPTGS